MIRHGEVNVETNLFTVMSTVTRKTKGQYDGTGREIKNFCTVKLNYAGGVLMP